MTDKTPAPSRESLVLSAAIDSAGITKASIAVAVGVTPANVSQWASGKRPVPWHRAERLAKVVGIDNPCAISSEYRGMSESGLGQAVPLREVDPSQDQRQPDLVIARLENDVHALSLGLAVLVATMKAHRPAEASAAAAAMRKRIPKKFRDRGLLAELLATLEQGP